ncbi:hypothetical protein J6590_039081 [Homalodisca vitripennis]|nr:hypothetical protein J6590_039081 [Homalodisca vitripennis]
MSMSTTTAQPKTHHNHTNTTSILWPAYNISHMTLCVYAAQSKEAGIRTLVALDDQGGESPALDPSCPAPASAVSKTTDILKTTT